MARLDSSETILISHRPARRAPWPAAALAVAAAFATALRPGYGHAQNAVPVPDAASRRHLVARRATGPVAVDGRLTEPDWLGARVAADFAVVRPDYAPRSAHATEVRVLYDDDHLYIAAFNRDSLGRRGVRMQDLRRDFDSPESDVFGVTLGPLGDRRTAFQFQVSPLGSQADVQAFDGGDQVNFNWDAMWRARTARSDSGWTVELAIPWRSLRYARGLTAWDVNFVRNTRRALQWSAWMPYPRQFASWRLTYAGVLDSLQPPPPRQNVRMRPYALGQRARDGAAAGRAGGDVGGELVWAPTANSLVEATVNTDFAQADVDRQVVNLTRFGVFFPERRQFFLENADLLRAGGITGRYVVQPFFSRRIGLGDDGSPRTLDGGARYAYRSGRTSAGALVMRQRAEGAAPGATFAVGRTSRFLRGATRVGGTVALRDDDGAGAPNVVTAVDAITRIGEQVQLNATLSTSSDAGRTGFAATYFAGRDTPRLYTGLLGAYVTRAYNPRTGFVSRPGVLLTSPAVTWTAQPAWRPAGVVWLRPSVVTYFYNDPANLRLQEGVVTLRSEVLLRNGASWTPWLEHSLQRPEAAVSLLPGVAIAPGTHDYTRGGMSLRSDQSRRLAATADLSTGRFFDGRLAQAVLGARWSPSPHAAALASYEVNRFASLGPRDTALVTHLAGPELRLFLSPRVQWSAFYQHNTVQRRGTLNARFSWEFAPLSFLYVVWNDRRALDGRTAAAEANSLIVKLSWLRQL